MRALSQNGTSPRPSEPKRNDTKTLEAVALAAGVSRATVSRVVNGSNRVTPDTRRAVEKAIRRLGYVPNRAARSLVTRRTESVGLVIPEPTTKLFGDPFFPQLIRGINAVLGEADQVLVLLTPQSAHDEEKLGDYLVSGHVDGAMLVSLHGADPLPAFLADRGIPVVVGGRPTRGAPVNTVDVDNVQGALQAVRHLVALGRRRIVTVTGPLDMAPAQYRLSGYRSALPEAGLGDGQRRVLRDPPRRPARPAVRRGRRLRRFRPRPVVGPAALERAPADRGDGTGDGARSVGPAGCIPAGGAQRRARDGARRARFQWGVMPLYGVEPSIQAMSRMGGGNR